MGDFKLGTLLRVYRLSAVGHCAVIAPNRIVDRKQGVSTSDRKWRAGHSVKCTVTSSS